MRRWLINPTYRCQHACSYCWVRQTVMHTPMWRTTERPLEDWVRAIARDKPDTVDVAGGEPLLLDWLPDLFARLPEQAFALSTNGVRYLAAERLAERRLPNLVSINVSYHPESRMPDYPKLHERTVRTLGHVYRVHVNVVDAPGNREKIGDLVERYRAFGVGVVVNPFEDSGYLGDLAPSGLTCQAGIDHLVVNPDGRAWPCLTALRSPYWEETCLGNWLDGPVSLERKPVPCHLQCHDYYVLRTQHRGGDIWGVAAKPAEPVESEVSRDERGLVR